MIRIDDRCVMSRDDIPGENMVCPSGIKGIGKTKEEKITEVLEYLKDYHTGTGNAIISEEIENVLNLDRRTLQRYIKELRGRGIPICSGSKGYYYAANQDEINRTVAWLNSMVTGVSNSRTGLLYAPLNPFRKDRKIKIVIQNDGGDDEEFYVVAQKSIRK